MRDATRTLACAAILALPMSAVAQEVPQQVPQPSPTTTAADSPLSGDSQLPSDTDPAAVEPGPGTITPARPSAFAPATAVTAVGPDDKPVVVKAPQEPRRGTLHDRALLLSSGNA
jgi:hypothetical protein